MLKVKRFNEERARFYAAQIAMGLGGLHEKHFIYRDLKPENVLVNEDGYLLLADFGLAKDMANIDFTETFCGTPEYFAPELIENWPHNKMVDWWELGIVLYEMVVGIPPFYSQTRQKMFDMILTQNPRFPDPIKHKIPLSKDVKDLILKLLDKDPNNRLGAQGDAEEVLSHPWFSTLDLKSLYEKKLVPPFIPTLSDDIEELVGFDQDC